MKLGTHFDQVIDSLPNNRIVSFKKQPLYAAMLSVYKRGGTPAGMAAMAVMIGLFAQSRRNTLALFAGG